MKKRLLLIFLAFIVLLPSVFAEIIVFSEYDTTTSLKEDKLIIARNIVLTNVGNAPIIPGELHFKLHEIRKNVQYGPFVEGFKAYDQYNTELRTNVIKTEKQTDLIISLWNPLLPGFSYPFKMEYEMTFKPTGLLFYEVNVPVEETTIPLQSSTNKFIFPKKFKVTFAPESATYDKENAGNIVGWTGRKNMKIEYSRLPLPKLPIRAVNLFWISLITLLLVPFVVRFIKRIRQQPQMHY